MVICAAQFHPTDGDTKDNIKIHLDLIRRAHEESVEYIQFPEMSLCGYQREKASFLAFSTADNRLDELRKASNKYSMIFSIGAPILISGLLYIGTFIITPDGDRIYLKHHLHTGEEMYFSERCDYNPRIKIKSLDYAFAICFDVENPSHWKSASSSKADVYSAGIFYTASGIENLHSMISKSSYKYNMNVIISNYSIDSYGLLAGGGSGIWNKQGDNIALLDSSSTGLAIAKKQNNKWLGKTILM